MLPSQGYFLFLPNPRGSYGQGEAFTQGNVKDFGYGDLRENARGCDWEQVSDAEFPTPNYPNSAWDVMGGPCGFRYNVNWSDVQACFAGHTTLSVFIVADAYGIYHLIDDITVNGKTFSRGADNSNGNNDPAGPSLTIDESLLPFLSLFQPPK